MISTISSIGELSPKSNLKNMISTYTKGFFIVKNVPDSPDFEDFFLQIARFL
jgi:hypothetical protein